jgi:helicase associated protein
MAPSGSKFNTELWERGYAALSRFHAREGNCCPMQRHVEGEFHLGAWVSTQRYYLKQKLLSAARKRQLDTIGFVWNWRDYLREQGFAALVKFKQRERHCRVPAYHREGKHQLGYWVSTQRRNKSEMSAERKARLEKIGFVWKVDMGRASWNAGMGANSHRATASHHSTH